MLTTSSRFLLANHGDIGLSLSTLHLLSFKNGDVQIS